jgi:hypothetical protein
MYIGSLDAQSNRATWRVDVTLIDDDTKDTIKVSDCAITMTVSDESGCQVLTGSSASGAIIFPQDDVFEWSFSSSQMAALCAGSYNVGVRISQNDITMQLIVGTLPIVDGVDHQ